jgi:hypothetical protein
MATSTIKERVRGTANPAWASPHSRKARDLVIVNRRAPAGAGRAAPARARSCNLAASHPPYAPTLAELGEVPDWAIMRVTQSSCPRTLALILLKCRRA